MGGRGRMERGKQENGAEAEAERQIKLYKTMQVCSERLSAERDARDH